MPEASSREFRPDLEREFQYLLGQMPRVDRETFQGLVIENAEVSERVLEAENELFDAWVRGALPREWKPLFEERLLSTPEGVRKAHTAKALMRSPVAMPAPAPSRWSGWMRRVAAIFCFAAAAGGGVWGEPGGDREGRARGETEGAARAGTGAPRLQAVARGGAGGGGPEVRGGAGAGRNPGAR
ncbi:hypothetical protein G7B40_042215, partial [Aetokthonos hydrillicola Thurmond2011]